MRMLFVFLIVQRPKLPPSVNLEKSKIKKKNIISKLKTSLYLGHGPLVVHVIDELSAHC